VLYNISTGYPRPLYNAYNNFSLPTLFEERYIFYGRPLSLLTGFNYRLTLSERTVQDDETQYEAGDLFGVGKLRFITRLVITK